LDAADVILVLTPDDEIENFLRDAKRLHGLDFAGKRLVHCSGRLASELAVGCHPLQSFGPDLYAPEAYERFPFAVDADGPDFAELFPKLPNPSFRVAKESKALYHAATCFAANFSGLLWKGAAEIFEKGLGVDRRVIAPLLSQTLENTLRDPSRALTGPLARGDSGTIEAHLAALEGRPEADLYRAFLKYFQETR